ncbi:hypothetical protein R1sor_022284 [Riccia sorocarpa]|uniref:Serine protease EDA2 n=1 Tax=Riccia sorocarpa TaxID=122646 RepID=A0ABD3GK49_9MARC
MCRQRGYGRRHKMTRHAQSSFVWLFLSLLSFAAADVRLSRLFNGDEHLLLKGTAKWLDQRIDHYNSQDRRTFKQRWFENTDHFKAPDGPIFLRICGESECPGIRNDYLMVMAEEYGAAVVTLEHRYYGKSLPYQNLSTRNLTFLSSKQSLFDLALFRNYYQKLVNERHNKTGTENSWIISGVSYSGALSAWFQIKFPHLSRGAISSSGVVLAVLNYTDFDKQVAESAGPVCASALRKVTRDVEARLKKNPTGTKKLFGAEQLKIDGDFFYFLADAAAIGFQYGNPDMVCKPLEKAYESDGDVVGAFAGYVKDFYIDYFGVPVDTYDQEKLKQTTAGPNSGDRMWWYQVCSEVAYFQAAYENSIRSSEVTVKYHLDLCANVFGAGTYPEVDLTNLYYGGTGIYGSKIVFLNGSQDPWRWASKQTSSPGEPSFLIKCHNCGHGTDMRGCPQSPLQEGGDASKCENPREVAKARELIKAKVSEWLAEPDKCLAQV